MLLPRFTVRTGLVLLTGGAFVAVIFREAALGRPWAIGVAVAIGFVMASLVLQAIAFALSLLLSRRGEESTDG